MAVAPQLPTYMGWIRKQREDISTEWEGSEVTYVHFERVPRSTLTDKPLFEVHTARQREEVATMARMNNAEVTDIEVITLSPDQLDVGDREEMFPPHAKYTALIYYFGWKAPEGACPECHRKSGLYRDDLRGLLQCDNCEWFEGKPKDE